MKFFFRGKSSILHPPSSPKNGTILEGCLVLGGEARDQDQRRGVELQRRRAPRFPRLERLGRHTGCGAQKSGERSRRRSEVDVLIQ